MTQRVSKEKKQKQTTEYSALRFKITSILLFVVKVGTSGALCDVTAAVMQHPVKLEEKKKKRERLPGSD